MLVVVLVFPLVLLLSRWFAWATWWLLCLQVALWFQSTALKTFIPHRHSSNGQVALPLVCFSEAFRSKFWSQLIWKLSTPINSINIRSTRKQKGGHCSNNERFCFFLANVKCLFVGGVQRTEINRIKSFAVRFLPRKIFSKLIFNTKSIQQIRSIIIEKIFFFNWWWRCRWRWWLWFCFNWWCFCSNWFLIWTLSH